MIDTPIRRGQVWKDKRSQIRVIIHGKSGGKFKAKILTDKPGVYKGSHTLSKTTLYKKFELE